MDSSFASFSFQPELGINYLAHAKSRGRFL